MKNPHSLEEIMDLYAPSLLRYAEKLVRNPHAAQDVVQQVFVRFSGLKGHKKPKAPAVKSWLYRSTHNQAVDLIRSEQRRKKLHETHVELREHDSHNAMEARQQQVLEQLHVLDDKERQVILLRLQEGLSYKEISEVTGLKEGHIGYLLHQGVRNLSTHFRQQGDSK
ncbi:sigma-70 family RNA polymerase sigma factor [Kiritimatiellota bacterium B12222]|nr:sigma-70 family RNA polymerase sigma factor [Kiritimatiellota bacterium B12222]